MPEYVRPMIEGKPVSMKDRVKQITHREKNPLRETTHTVPSITAEKHARPKKKLIPVAGSRTTPHVAPSRPIEQVLVGAWNAAKPERQGKAIMKAYDRYVHPKYQNEEERKRAAILRPKIEKIVGWTALGAEAAFITFVTVKGYQKLRSIDWSAMRVKKQASRRPIDAAVVHAAADVMPRHMKQAMSEVMGHLVGPRADWQKQLMLGSLTDLKNVPFSPELQKQIMQGYFEKFFNELQNPDVVGRINAVRGGRFAKENEIRGVLMDVAKRFVADEINRVPAIASMSDPDRLKDVNIDQFTVLLRVIRDWYRLAGCPGVERFGIQMR